jgi:Histidine kinase-, DNA gyrase B-, and HSP90-like ATPase
VELRYVARAGLLPELSRQTYDTFYKALREAVLNAIDAEATVIDLDFREVATRCELLVADDGVGMSTREFCDHFMSLGGSSRFGQASRFGRIGIGSLALLQYGSSATIETKRQGARTYTRAQIEHDWTMARDQRRTQLSDLPAGVAEELRYEGSPDDHFTRLRLTGVNAEVLAVGRDPADCYRLFEDLRRVLPLAWSDSPVARELAVADSALFDLLKAHCRDWSCRVRAHSAWESDIDLTRRLFGDDQAEVERWSGPVVPVHKKLLVTGDGRRRKITVAGFLLNQARATASWSGLTARVQNVAVEERTFFDVTSDPGFRKYITGEVWILGDVDAERLINIDRSSFNRECPDYDVVQRFMSRVLSEFKTAYVQRPQRQKVAVRRLLEDRRTLISTTERILGRAADLIPERDQLPSSESQRRQRGRRLQISDMLADRAETHVHDTEAASGYELHTTGDGERVLATVDPDLAEPVLAFRGREYRVVFVNSSTSDPPVVIRNRPREIRFGVRDHADSTEVRRLPLSLAMELAYLLADDGSAERVYEVAQDLVLAI